MLAELLSSRVRAQVLRLLFGTSLQELHHREIVRQSGMSESAVRQELGKLCRLGLLNRRKNGNRVYYSANLEHPLFVDLHQMVNKTIGLVDLLKQRLHGDSIRFAFVFGSIAQGRATANSDIDLMIIGDVGLRELTGWLSGLSHEIGREISPHVMTKEEYRERLRRADHFVTHVLKGPKLFVIGTDDDFEAMGG